MTTYISERKWRGTPDVPSDICSHWCLIETSWPIISGELSLRFQHFFFVSFQHLFISLFSSSCTNSSSPLLDESSILWKLEAFASAVCPASTRRCFPRFNPRNIFAVKSLRSAPSVTFWFRAILMTFQSISASASGLEKSFSFSSAFAYGSWPIVFYQIAVVDLIHTKIKRPKSYEFGECYGKGINKLPETTELPFMIRNHPTMEFSGELYWAQRSVVFVDSCGYISVYAS